MSILRPDTNPRRARSSTYWFRFRGYVGVLVVLWIIELIDRLFFGSGLETNGIQPRELSHLEGILFAPFLHGGWGHLMSNSLALLILGSVLLVSGWRDLMIVSVISVLVAGAIVWVIGKGGSVHIGASSIVFGYFGFLIASGYYQKTMWTILLAVLVVFFYGGALMTVFPTETVRSANLSWEGHLGGAIGGFLVARSRRKRVGSAQFRNF